MAKVVILKPGETFVLPKGGEIISVTSSGGGVPYSSCGAVPSLGMKCYKFKWFLVEDSYIIESLIFGGVEVKIDLPSNTDNTAIQVQDAINAQDDYPFIRSYCAAAESTIKRTVFSCVSITLNMVIAEIIVSIPDTGDLPKLKIKYNNSNPPSGLSDMYITGYLDNTCPACNSAAGS